MTSPAASSRCAPKKGSPARDPFPIFPGEVAVTGPIRKSRMGRRRAIVLGAIHVLILVHVAQWLSSGSTVSPVEPSESMKTLELGELNAGFVFFVLAILSTFFFGRFFCGWACHLVALQDLCGWAMKKLGVRPRPFRSRLLVFAPLVFAIYMFVWPTLKREVLIPGLSLVVPGAAAFLAPPPAFPGFSNHLVTEHFWATFPGLWVAIPFLAICGFATVYLLGAKGFCTYGCPYGGFFGPADAVAPGRIRVTDACEGCGHCTAVCTSNVRVHEEVREYGMVVNPGCMKCMDCVSTCPNDALYFGLGRPALSKGKPRTGKLFRKYDLGLTEELVLGAIFAAVFFAFRGVYDAVPLLMAIGIAGCTAFLLWKGWRLLRDSAVSLQSLKLKADGRLRRPGAATLAIAVILLVLTLQSGAVRWNREAAEALDRRVKVPAELLFGEVRPPIPSDQVEAARAAERHYRRADFLGAGGWGLLTTPEIPVRRAWLQLVQGRPGDAAEQMRRVVDRPEAGERARFDLARVLRLAGRHAEATDTLRDLVARDPVNPAYHRELATVLVQDGQLDAAVSELVIVTNLTPGDGQARAILVSLLERLGRSGEADRYRR